MALFLKNLEDWGILLEPFQLSKVTGKRMVPHWVAGSEATVKCPSASQIPGYCLAQEVPLNFMMYENMG